MRKTGEVESEGTVVAEVKSSVEELAEVGDVEGRTPLLCKNANVLREAGFIATSKKLLY